jgi:hypothetical protein
MISLSFMILYPLSISTLSIKIICPLSIKTLSKWYLICLLSIITLSILILAFTTQYNNTKYNATKNEDTQYNNTKYVQLSMKKSQYNNIQLNDAQQSNPPNNDTQHSGIFTLRLVSLCWVLLLYSEALCCVPLCLVTLCWEPWSLGKRTDIHKINVLSFDKASLERLQEDVSGDIYVSLLNSVENLTTINMTANFIIAYQKIPY